MVRVNLTIDEPLWLRLRAVAVTHRQRLGGRASVCGVVRELVLQGLSGLEAEEPRGAAGGATARKASRETVGAI